MNDLRLFILFLSSIPALAQETGTAAIGDLPSLEGARNDFKLEQLPSNLWPTHVILQENEGLAIKAGARGTLLRVVKDNLLIDFGRHGVMLLDPRRTNFYEVITTSIINNKEKDFPNLAQQIGNKLLRFDQGDESGAIRFELIENKVLYILLYVDQYRPDLAQELLDFGAAYADLEAHFPELIVVLMPKDKTFYDFGATTGYSVPMITPHVRKGYINSLSHGVSEYPAFVLCDANGKVVGKSNNVPEWDGLAQELQTLLMRLGIEWEVPQMKHHKSKKQTPSWPWLRR